MQLNDGHLSAIRWLNEHTGERFSHLPVRVRVSRTPDSPLAQRFDVVERPNDWERTVRDSSRGGEPSEAPKLRRELWNCYAERYAGEIPEGYATANVRVYVAEADLNIGRAGVHPPARPIASALAIVHSRDVAHLRYRPTP